MVQEPTNQDILDVLQSFAGSVDSRFENIDRQLVNVRTEISEVKQDLAGVKQDLADTKNELVTEIDRFVVLHQTLDVELASLRSRCERMETFMIRVGEKLDMKYQPT
jgi:hypothetical protein